MIIINKISFFQFILLILILADMERATILCIFIGGLLLGITGYSVFTAFGPASKELRDPFEEHED